MCSGSAPHAPPPALGSFPGWRSSRTGCVVSFCCPLHQSGSPLPELYPGFLDPPDLPLLPACPDLPTTTENKLHQLPQPAGGPVCPAWTFRPLRFMVCQGRGLLGSACRPDVCSTPEVFPSSAPFWKTHGDQPYLWVNPI